jgi:competence protein ComEA
MFRTFLRLVAVVLVVPVVIVAPVVPAWAQTAKPRTPTAAQATIPSPPAIKPAAIVNLNTATLVELEALPGVGAKTAARIMDYRQKRGPFKKIEELMNVQGIGEKSFLKLKPQITVAGNAPATHGQ